MAKWTKAEQAEALAFLAERIKPGDKVWTKVEHVARSGMMRVISAYIMIDGAPFDISRYVAKATGASFDESRWGVKMGGCGMDMTFALIYNLGMTLYPEGFTCNGSRGYTPTGRKSKHPRCSSNDHANGAAYRKGMKHSSGGYALTREHL